METSEARQVAEYETPSVVDYGDLRELTAGGTTGDYTDADFPVNTKRGDLTFSATPQ